MSAVPIDISYRPSQNSAAGTGRVPTHLHRDSFAHSQGIGGIAWGAASIGSWLREEVMVNSMYDKPPSSMAGSASATQQTESALSLSPEFGGMTPSLLSLEQDFCRDYTCCGRNLPTLHDLLQHYEEAHISPSPPEEPPVMRRMQNMEMVSTNEVFLPPPGANPHGAAPNAIHTQHGGTAAASGRTANAYGSGAVANGNGSGALPTGAGSGPGTGSQHKMDTIPGAAMTAGKAVPRRPMAGGSTGEDDELCIDDPARQLYVMERSENKPYRCPVIGCDKMYKNQNGLKYHRQHGHQNQKLHQNNDGTYSIIDPLSNAPYPDGMGMEKDKPYRCEICGKRYKNLNGLKYHRAHSTH